MIRYPGAVLFFVVACCLLPAACCQAEVSSSSETQAFAAAQRLMDAGTTATAFDAFTQFLQDYPASQIRFEARLRQGVCAIRLSRWAAARDIFAQLVAQLPATAPPEFRAAVSFYLAEIAYREGRYPDAVTQYQAVIASPQTSTYKPLAQSGLGWAYYQQGRCAESFAALASLRQGSAAEPLPGATLFALGDCARRLGRTDDAIHVFRQVITQDPNDAWADEATLILGELLMAQGHDQEARRLLETALTAHAASPLAPGLHVHAGQLALKARDLDAARVHFRAVATRADTSPYFVSALVGLGDVSFEQGDFDDAARHYAKALLASPRGPYAAYALFQQGQSLFNQGQWSRSRYLYEQLITAFPDSRFVDEAMFRLGESWAAERLMAPAIEQYARLVSRAPQSAWGQRAQLAWADAVAQAERWEEAYKMYERLLEQTTAPDVNGLAAVHAAVALAHLGQQPQALAMAQDLVRQSAPATVRAEAYLALARWAMDERRWDVADQHLTAAASLANGRDAEAEILFWRGWVAFQRRDFTGANTLWTTLQTRAAGHARAAESRAWRLAAVTRAQNIHAAVALLESWRSQLPLDAMTDVVRQFAGRLREEGLAEDAIQVYTFLISQIPEPTRAEWWFALGEVYEETHRVSLAVTAYARAAEAHPAQPWSVRGALAAARLLEADGNISAAAKWYHQVSVTNGPEAAVALERLRRMHHDY